MNSGRIHYVWIALSIAIIIAIIGIMAPSFETETETETESKSKRELVDVLNQADQVINSTENILKEVAFGEEEKANIVQALEKLKKAKEGSNVDEIKKAIISCNTVMILNMEIHEEQAARAGADAGAAKDAKIAAEKAEETATSAIAATEGSETEEKDSKKGKEGGDEVSGKGDLVPASWPTWKGGEINSEIKDLDEPFEYLLDSPDVSGKVYGLSRSGKQVKFSATVKSSIEKNTPACVYQFSAEDREGEMQAIWELGGRFLLTENEETWKLGGESETFGPGIWHDRQPVGDELVLSVNDVGTSLLSEYCVSMKSHGSLKIVLPKTFWAAIYQTLDKVAVENKQVGEVYDAGEKEVSWRLRSHGESDYSIIIQKSDLN
jgi:hypothetical protein